MDYHPEHFGNITDFSKLKELAETITGVVIVEGYSQYGMVFDHRQGVVHEVSSRLPNAPQTEKISSTSEKFYIWDEIDVEQLLLEKFAAPAGKILWGLYNQNPPSLTKRNKNKAERGFLTIPFAIRNIKDLLLAGVQISRLRDLLKKLRPRQSFSHSDWRPLLRKEIDKNLLARYDLFQEFNKELGMYLFDWCRENQINLKETESLTIDLTQCQRLARSLKLGARASGFR